ncbi:unnamed protein product [Rotaria sordida]|uniref:Iron-binding zinc finger CDGSH type domain-containing protein n=1 Tax=Rotaria sordida TaxID=392033 RepID=A0A814PIY0_9BILA|nr:unnamed protein product [Rotaria sordida]CAF1106152.1 unnamed protein product [Rotaria sordida]
MNLSTTSNANSDQSTIDATNTGGDRQLKNQYNNKSIDKYDIEDIINRLNTSKAKAVAYCRCWQSKKFPFCDATHSVWNKQTGDNVGPLIITKKSG